MSNNFRGIQRGYIATSLEGSGTEKDLYREVFHVYNEDLCFLGEIDPINLMSQENPSFISYSELKEKERLRKTLKKSKKN